VILAPFLAKGRQNHTNTCYLHRKLIGFYNRDEKCLQRGRNWVFGQVCASSVEG